MAFTSGTKILATDYNSVRNQMVGLLGSGSGNTGYGQATFNSTAVSAGQKVTAAHWDSLRLDILRIANHQGTSVTLTDVGTTTKVSAAVGTQYSTAITGSLTTNRFNLAAGQYSDELLVTSTRSTQWNQSISHFWTVDFGTAANARYFFNAGGSIRIIPNFSKSASNTINNDWEAIINQGTWSLNYDIFALNGTQASTIGFYDLTTTPQIVYTRSGGVVSGASMYSTNDIAFFAYCDVANNSSGTARYVYFQLYLEDNKTTSNPPLGVDEYVTGTLTNTIRMYRPSAAVVLNGVNVTAPTATTTTELTAGS